MTVKLPVSSSLFWSMKSRVMSTFPKINVSPEPSLFDEPLQIVVEGLSPSQRITLYLHTSVTDHCIYESFANYKASSQGTVHISENAALFGSYSGVEPMGLLWSMTPFAESRIKIARFLKLDVTKPQIYNLQVFDEEKQSLEECRNTKKSKILTSVLLNRWFMSPGVRRIPVREKGIIATLFLPPGDGPFPGLINMFGGYPGLLEYKSALHASHGFAALALAYVGADHLPKSIVDELDLEYFETAVQFMKNHKYVQGDNGIGVFAICKGAQIGIMMATYLEGIRCVVAINGSCMSGFGTFKYRDVLFDRDFVDYDMLDPKKDNNMADCAILPEVGEVEEHPMFFPFHNRRHVSYMIVSGLLDTCMPTYFGREMERLLSDAHHPDFKILNYPEAGHLIEPPNFPFCETYFQAGNPGNIYLTNGGKLKPHCKSQNDSWPKILNFLNSRLSTTR